MFETASYCLVEQHIGLVIIVLKSLFIMASYPLPRTKLFLCLVLSLNKVILFVFYIFKLFSVCSSKFQKSMLINANRKSLAQVVADFLL